MTNFEIFFRSIKKAEKNGFILRSDISEQDYERKYTNQGVHWVNKRTLFCDKNETVFNIIFSHKFAKAFWGEELIWITLDEEYKGEAWRVHLGEMVLAKDPLKYLEKFLKD